MKNTTWILGVALGMLATTASPQMVRAEALASSDDKTVTLTLTNNTDQTLAFTGVSNANPGNQFSVTPHTVAPGSQMTVTGTITTDIDLFAFLHFKDSQNAEVVFELLDPRYFHTVQPALMAGSRFQVSILNKTYGPYDARGLLIKAATLSISN